MSNEAESTPSSISNRDELSAAMRTIYNTAVANSHQSPHTPTQRIMVVTDFGENAILPNNNNKTNVYALYSRVNNVSHSDQRD